MTTHPGREAVSPSKTKRRKQGAPRGKAAPIEAVRRELELMKSQLATALPPHLTADRLLRVVTTALQTTPALLDCDRESLYRAVMTCAQLGLAPDGVLGHARLVASRGKVQLVPGYRGFIALARNSGQVDSIHAQAVYRNDHFDYAYGLSERLEHVPASGERGEITHFYAYAKFKDGGHHFDVMSRAEVDAVRDRGDRWVNSLEKGQEIVLRRIAGFLPLLVQKAVALADLHEAGRHAALDDLGEIVIDRPEAAERPAETPATAVPDPLTPRLEAVSTAEAEVSEEDLFAFLPPFHILEILDAVAEREMPEATLESLVGKPLDEVTEGETPDILRAIALWHSGNSGAENR